MKRWHHETEREPCGVAGVLEPVYLWKSLAGLNDCLAAVRGESRRGLTIWEPIDTKAPGPHLTTAWCCYIRTVIFYVRPFVSRGPHPVKSPTKGWYWESDGRSYAAWDTVESTLSHDDIVALGGQHFRVAGSGVRWARGRWWWLHRCERLEPRPEPVSTPVQAALPLPA